MTWTSGGLTPTNCTLLGSSTLGESLICACVQVGEVNSGDNGVARQRVEDRQGACQSHGQALGLYTRHKPLLETADLYRDVEVALSKRRLDAHVHDHFAAAVDRRPGREAQHDAALNVGLGIVDGDGIGC